MLNEAPKKKKQSYEDRKYQQKLDLNSCLQQAFQNVKEERNQGPWTLVEELKGVTLRRLGIDGFEIAYHKVFTGNQQDASKYQEDSKKFLDDVVKELKKHFKKLSGNVLEIKKKEEKDNIDKYSRLYAEHGSLYGSTTYGGVIGRFYLTCARVYHIESPKPQTGSPEKGREVWG